MPIIIKIFSDFVSASNAAKNFVNVNDLYDDKEFNEIYGFTDQENYTHAIIINTCQPKLNIKKENVIGLAFEPRINLKLSNKFIKYAEENIGKYLIGDNKNLPKLFESHFGYLWHTPFLKEIPVKNKLCSIMISSKKRFSGHIYRHYLVKEILKTNLPIDIWGNGCIFYKHYGDSRIKGNFKDKEPYLDYKFHISTENCQIDHYFSEKIIDPLICSCTPIYLGCLKIDNYFNDIIKLSGDIGFDINLLKTILNNQESFFKSINIEEVKSKINIKNLINSYKNVNTECTKTIST